MAAQKTFRNSRLGRKTSVDIKDDGSVVLRTTDLNGNGKGRVKLTAAGAAKIAAYILDNA